MKKILHKLIERLCYYCGVDSLFYLLNRKAKRILTFHNVIPDAVDPHLIADYVSHTESEFRTIVRELKRRFVVSTDLQDSRTVTITFDDGYLNQYEIAGRVLQEEGNIPAIVFVSGHNIDRRDNDALIVDKILLWISAVPAGRYLDFEVTNLNRGFLWHSVIRPRFVNDAASKGFLLFEELDRAYPYKKILDNLNDIYVRLRTYGISISQIRGLRERGWLVGWHTRTHFPLAAQDMERKRAEMTAPSELNMNNVVFSYPYGELTSVDEDAIKIAKELSYPCAVSNMLNPGRLCSRFFLPRMDLSADKFSIHFHLSGLDYFLHTGKLLEVVKW